MRIDHYRDINISCGTDGLLENSSIFELVNLKRKLDLELRTFLEYHKEPKRIVINEKTPCPTCGIYLCEHCDRPITPAMNNVCECGWNSYLGEVVTH